MGKNYDFSGWATKNDLLCADGRVIRRGAFKDQDGQQVPLVWMHQHNNPENVLGHAILENRPEGVYAYGFFNDSADGQRAKLLVEHGDINGMSIWANKLQQAGSDVLHGVIREVSLVLSGANPGATIVDVMAHSDDSESSGSIIYTDEELSLEHGSVDESIEEKEEPDMNDLEHTATAEKELTVQDIIDTMDEKQKNVLYYLVGRASEFVDKDEETEKEDENKESDEDVKHNAFETAVEEQNDVLSHDAMNAIIGDAKRYGSMKESFLQHAQEYGIENVDYLFPDAKNVTNTPGFISRKMEWVSTVMNGVGHTPFSRIKSTFADITADEARAKGYIKGNKKKEEVFSLLKRSTTPTTIYKKQKMDRDDVIDITDFDVIAWLKTEMRIMLDEEIARAVLIGDGRLASDDDKISESNVRPIWTDDDLYTIKASFDVTSSSTSDEKASAFIKAVIKARKNYRGSGNPVLFTTEDIVTDMLLLTDTTGRDLYESVDKLATKLRVSKIVTVPVMEGQTRTDDSSNTLELYGIIVNLADYKIGADKGGAINMFDDFDIDYNQQKYLIETRCSGALVVPYSAIAIEAKTTA